MNNAKIFYVLHEKKIYQILEEFIDLTYKNKLSSSCKYSLNPKLFSLFQFDYKRKLILSI